MTTLPSEVLPSYTTMDRHIQSAYSTQTSFEIEQHVGDFIPRNSGTGPDYSM